MISWLHCLHTARTAVIIACVFFSGSIAQTQLPDNSRSDTSKEKSSAKTVAAQPASLKSDSAAATPGDSATNRIKPVQFDSLAGPLPDTVKSRGAFYLVTGDIDVPAGKSVVIEPGTAFIFKNFTGLHVQGRLLALGTKEKPIVFTSENDRAVNTATTLYPNPFDWNGIYFHIDATGSIMTYCSVYYSVYGVLSETKFIRLDPVTFRQNGKSNCQVEGKDLGAADNSSFKYVLSIQDAKAQGVPVQVLTDPHVLKRNAIRYASFTVLLAGAGGSVFYGLQWNDAQKNLSVASIDDPAALRPLSESNWYSLRDKRNTARIETVACACATALAAAGFYWSFTF